MSPLQSEPVVLQAHGKKIYHVAVVSEDSLLFLKMRDYSSKQKIRPFSLRHVVSVEQRDEMDRDLFLEDVLSEQCQVVSVKLKVDGEFLSFDATTFWAKSLLYFHIKAAWNAYIFRYTLGIPITAVEIDDPREAKALYTDFEREYQYLDERDVDEKTQLLRDLSYITFQDRIVKEAFFDVQMHRQEKSVALFLVLIDELSQVYIYIYIYLIA